MIGPVVKIDPATLPDAANIHYLGGKQYSELPAYIGNWDAAMMPFAHNDSTRFISPTKTPEYLAAGKPVVSTSIRDVVRPYADKGLVQIGDTVPEFAAGIEVALGMNGSRPGWLMQVDDHLKDMSWDHTWSRMAALMEEKLKSMRTAGSERPSCLHQPGARAGYLRLPDRRRGICGQRHRRTDGSQLRQACSVDRSPQSHRRQCLRSLQRARRPHSPLRPAHLSHQFDGKCSSTCLVLPSGVRTSIACWRMSIRNWCRFRSIWTR